MAALSLVIPTYNRRPWLLKTVRSLLEQDFQDFELIIVDQSDDGSDLPPGEPALQDSRIVSLRQRPPSGTRAKNAGALRASSPIIVFIDDDVEPGDGFLRAHLEAHREAGVVAVAGRVIEQGKPECETVLRLSPGGKQLGTFDSIVDQDCMTAQGCNLSVSRSALIEIGGFDTRFSGDQFREETDFCFRLRDRGHRIVFRHKAALRHLRAPIGGCRAKCGDIRDTARFYQNEMIFFLKHSSVLRMHRFIFRQMLDNLVFGPGRSVPRRALRPLSLLRGMVRGAITHFFVKPEPLC